MQTQVYLTPKFVHPLPLCTEIETVGPFPLRAALSTPATRCSPPSPSPYFLWPEAKGSLLRFQLIEPHPAPALGASAHMAQLPHAQRPAHQPLVTSGTYFKLPLTTTAN